MHVDWEGGLGVFFARILYFAVVLLAVGRVVGARAQEPAVVSIQNNPQFSELHVQLQALVNAYGFHTINHFCIITYAPQKGDDTLIPFIYWPTQNKFIGWGTGPDPSIIGAGDYDDLTRDVIPDDSDSGSDYLRRSLVEHFMRDCRARGSWYTITKTAAGWVSVNKIPEFSSIKMQLQYLADHEGSSEIDEFCVVGQRDGSFLAAYVYWRTESRLFMWLPGNDNLDDPLAVDTSDVDIDLKNGLRDEEDAEDHRNEMQRSYAQSILRACQATGQKFLIKKSS